MPQSSVNDAERILQKEGLLPSIRKAPQKMDDIRDFYEKTKPVTGDKWEFSKGVIEIGIIRPRMVYEIGASEKTRASGTNIDYDMRTGKGSRMGTFYIKRDWLD